MPPLASLFKAQAKGLRLSLTDDRSRHIEAEAAVDDLLSGSANLPMALCSGSLEE